MSIDSAKVALITGAGRGIGRSVAIGLAQAGMDVVLMARTAAELEETRGHVAALGRSALAVRADVGCPEEVRAAVDQALERFGRIDVLVNAAGRQPPIGPLAENDAADWAQTIQVNLLGTFHCIQAVLPGMRQRRAGKIINFSGGGATSPRPNFSAYAVSKAAVVRLTETLAEELKPYNIQVNAVAPGAVNTRMLEEVLAAGTVAGPELNEAKRRKERGGTAPELAAALVAFLASEASGALTGKLISAPHDDWQNWDAARIAELMPTPMYTLRRLDAHTVKPLANRMRL
jgi:3-oxoacyl-[acyl-carrier protein] reductase